MPAIGEPDGRPIQRGYLRVIRVRGVVESTHLDALGPGALPRALQPQRAEDGAGRRRLVEHVEVDAGGAAREQVGALQGRVGDAELEDRVGLVGVPVERLVQVRGDRRAAALVKRLIWSAFVIGMIPGMIGTSIPAARASSTKSK